MAGAVLAKLKSLSLNSNCSASSKGLFALAFGAPKSCSFTVWAQTLPSKAAYHSNLTTITAIFRSLTFSSTLSHNAFAKGCLSMNMVQRALPYSTASVRKRVRQSEKRRLYNKARVSKVKTHMNKVFQALDELKNKPDAQAEELLPIDKLIEKAHSVINRAMRAGTLHSNTAERRKARLARRKKAVEIHHGWHAPASAVSTS